MWIIFVLSSSDKKPFYVYVCMTADAKLSLFGIIGLLYNLANVCELSVHPAVRLITLRSTPLANAADVAACLVEWALKIDISTPLFLNSVFIHLLTVCEPIALCGLFIAINKLSDLPLTREHREPGLTDWNATLWVDRVTQEKNNGVFHLCPIAL